MSKSTSGYFLVIGLTGPIASGKGLAAKAIHRLFDNKEPIHSVLLSDYIREVVRAQGKPLTRDTLREAGNALREKNGPGAWAKKMIEELPETQEGVLVVDSIRNPGEIEILRETFGDKAFIIATDAPPEDRVKRVIKRAREEDSAEVEEIKRQMMIEMEDNPETGFAIERCREMADFVSLGKETKQERMAEIVNEIQLHMLRREGRETERERMRRIA